MKPNRLFNFLKFTGMDGYTFARSSEGSSYYRVELPALAYQIKDYTLGSHHFSIYEKEDGSNPYLSQYHYTAYFTDNMGLSYRLHVYFDGKDKLAGEPIFSQSDAAGGWKRVDISEMEDVLIDLATAQLKISMFNLKTSFHLHIQALEKAYQQSIQLSETLLGTEGDAYYNALHQSYLNLKGMLPLLSKKHPYVGVSRLLKCLLSKMGDEIPAARAVLDIDLLREPESVEAKDEVSVAVVAKEEILPRTLDEEIVALHRRFQTLTSSIPPSYDALELADILAHINGLSVMLDSLEGIATKENIECLLVMHQVLYNLGINWLRRFLVLGDLDALKQLHLFYPCLNAEHLGIALQTKRADILKLLLEEGKLLVDEPVKIGATTYSSLVRACFEREKDGKGPMADCLSVLIRCDAFLFEEDESGLPLAEVISSVDHSLYQAFQNTSEQTLNSPLFYKKLAKALSSYLEHHEPADRAAIEYKIRIYQKNQNDLAMLPSYAGNSLAKARSSIANISKSLPQEILERIKKDPEVLYKQEELTALIEGFLKLCPQHKQSSIIKESANYWEDMHAQISKADDISEMDYEEIKKLAINFFDKQIVLVEKSIELKNIEVELQKKGNFLGASRKTKQLVLQQKALSMEIQQLSKEIQGTPEEDMDIRKALRKHQRLLAQLAERLNTIEHLDESASNSAGIDLSDAEVRAAIEDTCKMQ